MELKQEIRNYGFDEDLIDIKPEDYVLGSNSKLPNIVRAESGQWKSPVYEPQADKYETWGCTVWGMQNQIEMFEMQVFGREPNYDERFNYIKAGIKPGGANPQLAYESARNDGLINNEPMPDTLDEFKDPSYITKARELEGKAWLRKREFLHDYLDNTSKESIISNLIYSPISISVTAWKTDADGFYIDGGMRNTHLCVARGYIREQDLNQETADKYNVLLPALEHHIKNGGQILKCFDSYDHSNKLLHPDHRIAIAKRIWIDEKIEKNYCSWMPKFISNIFCK